MTIVTPFRPFPAESQAHHLLGDFDWHDALRMLAASAARVGAPPVTVITDVDAPEAPVPALRYVTQHRRLMLWLLEVACSYVASDDFVDDTVMLSPDMLVVGDLRPFFVADLGVVVRTAPKYTEVGRTVLNCAQWWRVSAKARLVEFYTRALAIAEQLPEDRIRWGADTDPLIELLSPIVSGPTTRAGLSVVGHPELSVMATLTKHDQTTLSRGLVPMLPIVPLVDFKYMRKLWMRRYFDAVLQPVVQA